MAVRVKIKIRVGEKEVETIALVNSELLPTGFMKC